MISKKYIYLILICIIPIVLFKLYINNIFIRENYLINSTKLPIQITFEIPYLTQEIHLDINSDNIQCKQYIQEGNINFKIYNNDIVLDFYKINLLSQGEHIDIKILKNKNTLNDCQFSFEIFDPYANMLKMLLLYILPHLLILYFLIKITWIVWIKKRSVK